MEREEFLLRRLTRPQGVADVVLDTDTYNEVDDQFALSYLLRSPERLRLQAVYAAPFHNHHSASPADGMEKSYQEIFHILGLNGSSYLDRFQQSVYRGSPAYLPDEHTPVDSPAARDLVKRGLARGEDAPLYVVSIGAITNVASALLMEPGLRDKLVVIWLGGHAPWWPDTKEFNMMQDVAAARVVFGSGVPLVQLPCQGVVSAFTTTGPELEHWLRGKNELCDYLCDLVPREARQMGQGRCWSRPIWDVTAVAWLTGGDFMLDRLQPAPIPEFDHHYGLDPSRHLMRMVYAIRRDLLFEDLFTKLAR